MKKYVSPPSIYPTPFPHYISNEWRKWILQVQLEKTCIGYTWGISARTFIIGMSKLFIRSGIWYLGEVYNPLPVIFYFCSSIILARLNTDYGNSRWISPGQTNTYFFKVGLVKSVSKGVIYRRDGSYIFYLYFSPVYW